MTIIRIVAIAVLLLTSVSAHAQNPRPSKPDSNCCSLIEQAMRDAATIKPGMKRADLAAKFTHEGGLDFFTETIYVWKTCPYIKIRVSFTLLNPSEQKESPSDIVKSVSNLYIQYPIKD